MKIKRNIFHLLTSLLVTAVFLAGCNLPVRNSGQTPTINVTQAYQTVQARLTQGALLTPAQPSPTVALPPTQTPTLAETTPTVKPTSPPVTAATSNCDIAAAGNPIDVTVPDGTNMQPGQAFTKTWRLKNDGTCTWTKNYSIALFSGEAMSAPASVSLPGEVAPGQSVDVSVDMAAPTTAGIHQGYWKLRNASNAWFGIGPGGGSPFWVSIIVLATTGTVTPSSATPGTGTPTATATPGIQASGTKTLIPTDKINLDNNTLNSGSGEDLSYVTDAGGNLQFIPINGALISGPGNVQPSLSECQSTPMSAAPMALTSQMRGSYICYRTDLGLFGWLQLNDFRGVDMALTIRLLTWSLP